jgi:hypothetical protein
MRIFKSLLLICILWSCGEVCQNATKVENFNYHNTLISWKINVPEGWEVIKLDQKNLEISKDDSLKVDDSHENQVSLTFQKDQYNMFQSALEPFIEDFEGEWEDNIQGVKQLLCDLYTSQGIGVDTAYTLIEEIGGHKFLTYQTKLYDREGKLKLSQMFYSSHINNYDFSVCLSFNSPQNKEELEQIWRSSKFN